MVRKRGRRGPKVPKITADAVWEWVDRLSAVSIVVQLGLTLFHR